ncbi:carbohydrate binding family 9 domain-containing protein [Gammaproteobacteria bacterium]|nr:carbohydrate binding family 9 domain-containing protein [Gammaproteobacteria bacterium]
MVVPVQAQGDIPLGGITGGKSFSVPSLPDSDIRIDGQLDDDVWARAALVNDFHQMAPFEYDSPSQRTEVRVFYSSDAIYIGARMFEEDPSLITANVLLQGQGLPNDDSFNIMLDPYLDRRSGFLFEINANGVRVEGIYQNVSGVDRNWEGIWQAGSNIDEQGWTTEMRIPFQTLSFDPGNTEWGINFRRTIRRNSEEIGWVSRNRLLNPSIAGTATGLEDLRQGLGLDVVPYLVMRQERVFGPAGYDDQALEPQIDMFYKITPQLNAALTINTDFSATEVDTRQVNLTRFNLFFPEQRDFFIRDADIFQFGRIGVGANFNEEGNDAMPRSALQNGRPFFSRRIGLSPGGQPVDINVGAKVSGRTGDWDVGTLVVSQDEDALTGVDAQTVFVGRAALNILNESLLGVIATSGDPRSNIDNSLIGADFRYRNSRLPGNKVVEGEVWYQQTDTDGISGDNSSWGLGISSPNTNGWRGGYRYKRIEDNFNPAMGFVNQTGIEDHALDFGFRQFLQPGNYVRSVYAGFDSYRNSDLNSGQLISQVSDVRVNANNNIGDSVSASIVRTREVLSRPFTIYRASNVIGNVVIPTGDYEFTQGSAGISFAGRRRLSGSINVTWGDYFGGNNLQRSVGIRWQPSNRYNLGMNVSENEIHLPQGNFTVRLTSFNTLINFTPELSWSNRIQYDNVSEGIGINSRLRWIPTAGQEGFLVLNWGMVDLDKDNDFASINGDLSLKFNYTFRF